jgi:hypothetical protein
MRGGVEQSDSRSVVPANHLVISLFLSHFFLGCVDDVACTSEAYQVPSIVVVTDAAKTSNCGVDIKLYRYDLNTTTEIACGQGLTRLASYELPYYLQDDSRPVCSVSCELPGGGVYEGWVQHGDVKWRVSRLTLSYDKCDKPSTPGLALDLRSNADAGVSPDASGDPLP